MKRAMFLVAWVPLVACLLTSQLRAADVEQEDEAKEHENAKKYLSKAKITLEDAIALALKKYPGGAAVEAGFEVDGDDDFDFVVEIASGGRHHEMEIDALTGKVESDEEEPVAESSKEDNENTAAKSKITLIQAITAAAGALPNSKAFEIEAELKDGKLVYEVDLLSGKDIYHVRVDGTSGKVLGKEKVD